MRSRLAGNLKSCALLYFAAALLLWPASQSRADLAAGTFTAGGHATVPQAPATPGSAGALGQPVVGVSGDGTLWSGLITPDSETVGQSLTATIWMREDHKALPGATLTVPVYLKGTSPFSGLQAFINFDKDVLISRRLIEERSLKPIPTGLSNPML